MPIRLNRDKERYKAEILARLRAYVRDLAECDKVGRTDQIAAIVSISSSTKQKNSPSRRIATRALYSLPL